MFDKIKKLRIFKSPESQRRLDIYDLVSKRGIVLDLGCGDGETTSSFAGRVIGLEYDWKNCQRSKDLGLSVVQADARCLPFREDVFNECIGLHVLDHTSENRLVFKEIGRVLKPGARFFGLLPALVGCKVFHQKIARQYHDGGHTHYPYDEMQRWAKGSALEITTLRRTSGFFSNIAEALSIMGLEFSATIVEKIFGTHDHMIWRIACRLIQFATGTVYFIFRPKPCCEDRNSGRGPSYGIDWILVARKFCQRS